MKIWICVIVFLVAIAFIPSLENGFTNWDDPDYIIENKNIKDLSWKNIKTIFNPFQFALYHPLVFLSYSIEYHFFKLNPRVYHTTNFTLHMFNCLFVFWLIFMLSGKVATSVIAALLFGIHPLRVEPVAWVTGRKDVLYAFFFLAALISHLYYRKKESIKYYYFSLFLFILSILSKPTAVTLVPVLLLCDYFFYRKFNRTTIVEKIPYFAVAFIFGCIAIFTSVKYGALGEKRLFTLFHNILIAGYGIVFYLIKTVAPFKLSCTYPYPANISKHPPLIFLFSFVIVVILIVGIFYLNKYSRKITFGSLFFLFTILPVLQLIPVGPSIAADRYTYIPSIGLFYIVGEGFYRLYWKKMKYAVIMKPFLLIILTGIIATLSFLTWHRCHVWKDSITLWSDVIKKYQNIPAAYNNRGNAYTSRKEYNKAISDYTSAIRVNPNHLEAYNNRGLAYYAIGEYDRAISDYNQALRLNPDYADAYNNRGVVHATRGEYERAILDYREALRLNPDYADAYNNRGLAYYGKGEYDMAISDYNQAIRINPYSSNPYNNRGNAYDVKGEYERTISDYNQAIRIDPFFLKAYYNRGLTYGDRKEYGKAIYDYTRAIQIDSDYIDAYYARGIAYYSRREYKKAILDYNRVISMNPNFAGAYNNRGIAYYHIKKYDSALKDIHKARSLGYKVSPEFLETLLQKSSEKQ